MSKTKSALKSENAAVLRAVVKETLKAKRQEEMLEATKAAADAAKAAEQEAAAAAQPKAGLLGFFM